MRSWIVALFAVGLLAIQPAHGDKPPTKQVKPATEGEDCCCCADSPLKIGALASSLHSVTLFRAMRFYFSKNKMPIEFVLYSTYDGLNEALLKKQVDVAWNTPLAHARFHAKAGDSQTLVMRDVDCNYRVKLVARKDARIATLADLAGRTMVFGSSESADSTVLPIYFLKKKGVNFDKVKIVSLHDKVDELGCPCDSEQHVLAGLLAGTGQAGVIGESLWKHLQTSKPEQAGKLEVVWTSPPFSHCVFTARKDFDKDIAARFSKLMTSMNGRDPVTAQILKIENCKKWVPAGKEARAGFTDLLEAVREKTLLPVALRK